MLSTIEFWSKWTAIGSLALTCVTLGLLVPTVIGVWVANKAAKDDLRATREATQITREAAERQIEAAHLPLLIDLALDAPIPPDISVNRRERINLEAGRTEPMGPPFYAFQFNKDDEVMRVDPRWIVVAMRPSRLQIMLPLRNVGTGLAVIEQDVTVTGDGVGRILGGTFSRYRVPPNETTRLICEAELQKQPAKGPYEIRVRYGDYIGRQATVARVRLDRVIDGDTEKWQIGNVQQLAVPEPGAKTRSPPIAADRAA